MHLKRNGLFVNPNISRICHDEGTESPLVTMTFIAEQSNLPKLANLVEQTVDVDNPSIGSCAVSNFFSRWLVRCWDCFHELQYKQTLREVRWCKKSATRLNPLAKNCPLFKQISNFISISHVQKSWEDLWIMQSANSKLAEEIYSSAKPQSLNKHYPELTEPPIFHSVQLTLLHRDA